MAFNYMTASLEEIRDHVIQDGLVDEDEVQNLQRRLYDDGVVDRDEANLLFEINDATTRSKHHAPSWQELFVKAISDHLLKDTKSPGEIDDAEGQWLVDRITTDGQCDVNERSLLVHIKHEAKNISPHLQSLLNRERV